MQDRQYYIELHENNKKYLKHLNLNRYISGSTKIIDRDGENILIELTKRNNNFLTTYKYIRVKDSSTEQYHFLSVPNSMRNCQEAIAWTFGLTISEYKLFFET